MIDKHTPLKFVADKDQRLVGDGEMIEAQNVTITERGTGSGSILKTSKGFSGVLKDTGVDDLEDHVVVIGQVVDEQRGFAYFFVTHDTDSDHTKDMIVQYSHSSGKYKIVFNNTWLNFEKSYFVKANVVSKSFQRDGVLQTVIYFTDNVNPPRKINVDRALAGDYNGLSTGELDIALSTMRGASTHPPTFVFETDDSVPENNFEQNSMQYATQIIYKDGEESALSPYSKLAVSRAGSFGGLETSNYNVSKYEDNVCKIKHNIPSSQADLKAVRLLARRGNSGAFFVIDEFNPLENLTRDLYGSSVQVYSAETREYTFFNNILGQPVSDTTAQKLYDNVPLKAGGQAVIENRLMFSNYTEGRENHTIDPAHVSITPQYSDVSGGTSSFIADGDANSMFGTSAMNVTINLNNANGIDAGTSFDAGTLIDISFNFKPVFTATAADIVEFDVLYAPNTGSSTFGSLKASSLTCNTLTTQSEQVSISLVLPETLSSSTALANFIQSQLDEIEDFFLKYTISSQVVTSVNPSIPDTTFSGNAKVYFKFGETVSSSNDQIVFEPRITRIDLGGITVADAGGYPFSPYSPENNAHGVDGDAQSEVTYSSVTNTLGSKSIVIDEIGVTPTFKAGATHGFGIVYYDKYGRSGFVNEIGEVYVESPPERSSGTGSVSMEFDLSHVDFDAPSWAESYQIVYSGSSVSNVMQYTVGGAYPRRLTTDDGGGNHDIDTSVHNIYVSLKTLDQYRRDKDVLRNYSFTKGDKLRIISHKNDNNSTLITDPLSSASKIMEFDIVGVETFQGLTGDPIRKQTTDAASSATNPHEGTFLVLTAPAVEATSGVAGSVEKYEGFDWNQITATDYNNTDTVGNVRNWWNREVLVEIITPQKSTAEKVYYEIGERKRVGPTRGSALIGDHGPEFTVVSGDVHFRPVAAKIPKYNPGGIGDWRDNANENPEEWVYTPKYVEDPSTSDLFESRAWDRGRAHSVFKDAAEVNRYNGITYSDPYADDTAVLKLSSFTPANINFFDLPTENGVCEYIGKLNDKLIAIQENKVSLVGVNKGVIQTGSQAGLVALSTEVLQNIIPYAGDYGTQNPESVLIRNGVVYFADRQRYAIVRLSERSYDVISDIDIKSDIEASFDVWNLLSTGKQRIVCGYDPSDDIFYFTLLTQITNSTFSHTYGFDEKGKFWQGKYTFFPDAYATIKDYMLICDWQQESSSSDLFIFKMSEQADSNSFPPTTGTPAESKVTVVSNVDPSAVKAYESISLEADSKWTVSLETSSEQTTGNLSFSEREDAFYAFVTGDTSNNSYGGYIPVGKIASIDGNVLTMENSLRGIHIPKGYRIARADVNSAFNFDTYTQTVTSVDRANKKITINATPGGLQVGDALFVFADKSINGDQIRGHYCEIKCSKTPSGTAREELYAINAKFVESKANHRKG